MVKDWAKHQAPADERPGRRDAGAEVPAQAAFLRDLVLRVWRWPVSSRPRPRAHIDEPRHRPPPGRCGEIDPGLDYAALRRGPGRGRGPGPSGDERRACAEQSRFSSGARSRILASSGRLLFGGKLPRARVRLPAARAPSEAWSFHSDPPAPATPRAADRPGLRPVPAGRGRQPTRQTVRRRRLPLARGPQARLRPASAPAGGAAARVAEAVLPGQGRPPLLNQLPTPGHQSSGRH